MLNRFFRLRHDAVVCGNNKNDNVRRFCTPRAHRRKGCVAGGVEEGNHAFISFHVVSADVLGNTPCLTTGHSGLADVVEQRSLTVVNVTHDRHNGRSGLRRTLLARQRLLELLFDGLSAFQDNTVTEFFYNQRRGVLVEHLINVGHYAQIHQLLDHLAGFDGHLLRQVPYRDVLRDIDVVDDFLSRLLEAMLIRFVRQLLPASTTAPSDACFYRLQIAERKIVSSLLTSRTGNASAFEAPFTGPAPQLVARRNTCLFGGCRV